MRNYPPSEYERTEGAPLPPQRLAAIQRSLPERDRLGFLHSLSEEIADKVLSLATVPADKETR
jgi:hypothetical protein